MEIHFVKTCDEAVVPAKAGENEVGWDLTIISKHKTVNENTIMFDTGIKVKPPDGFYTEIVARSSIYKYGWILANGIGIIDPTYRDTLKIVLVRIDPNASDIPLPCRIAQLILKRFDDKIYNVSAKVVEDLDETYRKGGFGST